MRTILRSLLVTGLIQGSNIISGIILARVLMPDGRGELAAVMLWPAVLSGIGIIGINEATTYFAARRGTRPDVLPGVLNAGLLLGLGLSLFLLPIGWFMVDTVFADYRPAVRDAAFLYLLFIPLNFLGLVIVGFFQGRQNFDEWNFLRAEVHVAYALFVPAVHLAGLGSVAAFAAASLAANGLLILTGLILLSRRGWLRPARPAMTRRIVGYGWRIHLGRVATTLGERLDQLLISLFLPAADLGYYVVAYTVANAAALAPSTLGALAFSRISDATPDRRAELFGRYLRASLVTVAATSAVMALIAQPLVGLVFGDAFQRAVPLAWILIAGMIPFGLKLVLTAGLKGYGHPLEVSRAETLGVIIVAVALAGLLPLLGLAGAAWSVVIGQFASAGFMIYRIWRVCEKEVFRLLVPKRGDLDYIRSWMSRNGK